MTEEWQRKDVKIKSYNGHNEVKEGEKSYHIMGDTCIGNCERERFERWRLKLSLYVESTNN